VQQLPADLARLAADQHGVISLAQLDAVGVTRRVRRTMVERGWLVPEAPRVLAVAGAPPSWRRALVSGLLSLGPEAVISHRAAAALHGFDRARTAVSFSLPPAGRGRRGPFEVHTTNRLEAIDVMRLDGLPVTSATRTVIDLARLRVPTVELEAAIDSAIRLGLSAPSVLAERLGALRGPGRWGCRRIDHLLPDSGGHSPLERAFLRLVRSAGLPRPTPQVVHRRAERRVARVDFLFEPFALVVEVNGRRGRASDAERAKDARRRNELQALGRTVLEYTNAQVRRDGASVARQVEQFLRAAGWPGPPLHAAKWPDAGPRR
jgi:very-short-patch-repair endonuclease